MNPQIRKYFALIVHYGPAAPTQQAVNALDESSVPPDKIVVIDHGVDPLILSAGPMIIRPAHNAGYAAGINLGLGVLVTQGAQATDIVIVMNNDILVSGSALESIRDWWQQHDGAYLLTAAIEENDQVIDQVSSVNLFTGRAETGHARFFALPYLHGAFLVAPLRVWLQVQGLPEKYFMYWEDVSFSQRLRRRGVSFAVDRSARVRHLTQPPEALSDAKLYYLVRNGAFFLTTETIWPWRLYWRALNRVRLIYHALRRHQILYQALSDAQRGRLGPQIKT